MFSFMLLPTYFWLVYCILLILTLLLCYFPFLYIYFLCLICLCAWCSLNCWLTLYDLCACRGFVVFCTVVVVYLWLEWPILSKLVFLTIKYIKWHCKMFNSFVGSLLQNNLSNLWLSISWTYLTFQDDYGLNQLTILFPHQRFNTSLVASMTFCIPPPPGLICFGETTTKRLQQVKFLRDW